MCEHLEAIYKLEIRDLLINLPPRMGKSLILGALFPAWCWIKDAGLRFLFASFSQQLSVRDSVYCRRLITSHWYKNLWGDTYHLMGDVNNKLRFDNNKYGYRIASSVNGTITGQGGDIICCDDPNDINEVHSEVHRQNVNDWWDFTFSTRFCLAATARRVVSQQRSHQQDLSGHILAQDDPSLVTLILPMEFESSRRSMTIPLSMSKGKIWKDPRKKEGDLLWPNGIDDAELIRIKRKFKFDSYTIAGQLQQRPSPAEGGILQAEWYKHWKEQEYPEFDYIIQSWDTALTTGKLSCYSACTSWGIFKDKYDMSNIMLLSVFREKVEYPELREMAVRLSNNYNDNFIDDPIIGKNPPDLVLIEAKVNGYSLFQDLMRANIPVMKFEPNRHGDKLSRCRVISHLIKNGLVWLPTESPKCEFLTQDSQLFLEASVNFPNSEYNDIIDSMSQTFIYVTSNGWLINKEDPRMDPEPNFNQNRPYYITTKSCVY